MARLYEAQCVVCNRRTQWVHPDLEPGKLDRCMTCGWNGYNHDKLRREAARVRGSGAATSAAPRRKR